MANNVSRYDVFLSFRGDTRHTFTDHLYMALRNAGITPFRDKDEIDRGEDLKPEIERGIKESRASIVVISQQYATSRWCLDELCLILEQNYFILPIFYHVDPSHVRKQEGSFDIKVKCNTKWTEDNVERWKAALTKVGNMTGEVPTGSEAEFISKIVDTVNDKLNLKRLSTPPHLTGLDARAESINSWLRDEQSDEQVLLICGMGGSGKTTLATHIYNSNKKKFKCSSFLEDIREQANQRKGLIGLQKQLLRDILWSRNKFTVSEGTCHIEGALKTREVFIVLDDIDNSDQLGALLGKEGIHKKSKIIITTRNSDIQKTISCRCLVYELKLLNENESLELLSLHAFGSKIPIEGFKDLALQVARYCAGNPLALKVLGSSLRVSSGNTQGSDTYIKRWESRLKELNSLKGDLDQQILGILRRSYDSLPGLSHKKLFLHIAVFLVGEYKDDVENIMEQDSSAIFVIPNLQERCLITVSPSNKLMMHQLLQEMGRKIVREESVDPAQRSMVWHDNESYSVLANGSRTIEGLALDMNKVNPQISALRKGLLAKMDHLKLLRLKHAELTWSQEKLPALIWLCLHGYYLKTVPSGLLTSCLVALDMSYGKLIFFEPPNGLNSLKILNFKGCDKLVRIRNLARLPNLETLILWDCIRLSYICENIGGLPRLALLDLTGCKNLWQISRPFLSLLCAGEGATRQMLFSLPQSLKFLFLNDCDIKDNDVLMPFDGQSILKYINLGNSLFESLPHNIDLRMLLVLDLTCCPNLKSLTNLPKTLEELYIHWCPELEKITFESSRFGLKEFGYVGCINLSEVQGLFKLVSIRRLDEADVGHMHWIKKYEDFKVDLVGDEITKRRTWFTQMLDEYGIRSTFLPFMKDDQNMKPQYMSASPTLPAFCVPLSCKKGMIKGLNITLLYRSSGEDADILVIFAKISNRTKGLTWIYNPVVFGKPKVGEDVIWVSYWPIGKILDPGDEIEVSFMVGKGFTVSGCGAALVDGQLENENCENNTSEEVIGGDLCQFEVITGGYYLCRRDLFTSSTPNWLKILISDTIHYTDLEGWQKSRKSQKDGYFKDLKTFRGSRYKRVVVKLDILDERIKQKAVKNVSSLPGVKSIGMEMEAKKLTVIGDIDPVAVVSKLRKICHVEIVSVVGYVKEPHYSRVVQDDTYNCVIC